MEDTVLFQSVLVCPWCNDKKRSEWMRVPKNAIERDTGTSLNAIYLVFRGCSGNMGGFSEHQRDMTLSEYKSTLAGKVRECILSNPQYIQMVNNGIANITSVVMYRIFVPDGFTPDSGGKFINTIIDENFIMDAPPPYSI